MGFGLEVILLAALGFMVLGPKQMHAVLRTVARAKSEFDKVSGNFKSELAASLHGEEASTSAGPRLPEMSNAPDQLPNAGWTAQSPAAPRVSRGTLRSSGK